MPCEDRTTPEATERTFPYIVEMLVPEGGFGRKLDAMHQFHARHGIQAQRGRSRREDGRDYIRWCYTRAAAVSRHTFDLSVQNPGRFKLCLPPPGAEVLQ